MVLGVDKGFFLCILFHFFQTECSVPIRSLRACLAYDCELSSSEGEWGRSSHLGLQDFLVSSGHE